MEKELALDGEMGWHTRSAGDDNGITVMVRVMVVYDYDLMSCMKVFLGMNGFLAWRIKGLGHLGMCSWMIHSTDKEKGGRYFMRHIIS